MKRLLLILVVPVVLVITLLVVVLRAPADTYDWSADCARTPASTAADGQPAGESAVVHQVRRTLRNTGLAPTAGIDVVDLDTCTELVSWKSGTGFPTASVVKLLIALDVIDGNGPAFADTDRLHRMLAASDDSIASAYWSERGGSAIVRRVAAKLHLRNTRPPDSAGQWGSTVMSPADVATVYRYITSTLDPVARQVLTAALGGAQRTAADGFDQYFGIPGGLTGQRWAIKQGWGSSGDRRVLNTTGIVEAGHRYAVVVLTTWPRHVDWPTATAALTAAVQDLKPALGSPR